MDDELVGLLFLLVLLFICIIAGMVLFVILILLVKPLFKSEKFQKLSKKWDIKFVEIEEFRERLTDIKKSISEQNMKIETLEKQNEELLKKLDYLVGPAVVRDKTKDE